MAGISIATAYIDIVPSFNGAQAAIAKGLKGAGAGAAGSAAGEDAGQGFASGFGGHVASAAKIATGLIAGFAGGAAISSGLKRLVTIQDATTALNVQFQDTAKTGDFMAKILDTVQGTPFNLDQFANAGKNLVAFGTNADKVPGYLKAMGEAAAASGKGAAAVDMMSDAFGTMATEGSATNDAINSIEAQGVPAMKILANHFGVSTAAMKKMVSEGTVPAEEAMDALSNGIMNGSDGAAGATVAFAGSMAALRETFSGALGGMKASVARFGANLLKPWLDDMTHGLQGASGLLDSGGKTLGQKSQELRDKIVPALTDMWSGLTMDAATRAEFDGQTTGLVKLGSKIREFADTIRSKLNDLWSGLTMDAATRAEFAGQTEGLVTFGAKIRSGLDFLKPYLQDIRGAFDVLINKEFNPENWGHDKAEVSPVVVALFKIRAYMLDAAAFVRTLVSGDFDPSQWGHTTEEDSPIVDKVFRIRKAIQDAAGFIRTLVTGDFDPSQWSKGTMEDSPIVAKVFSMREKIGATIEWIKSAWSSVSGMVQGAWAAMQGNDPQAFYDSLGVAGERTKELVTGVRDLLSNLPSFSDILAIMGPLLSFVADHIGTIVEWLPAIVAGFLLYKGAMLAVNVANLANIPISIAQMGVTLTQASAMRALAISQGYVRVGTIQQTINNLKSMATWIGSTAAMIAHKVAALAVVVATNAMAAAQWLWNAAMDASPIMIVVLAVAALVAGIIWAWNNVDWFRDAVLKCWEWIQNAAQWAWDNVLKPVFDGIVIAVQHVGEFFGWLWDSAIKPAIDFIGAAIQWLWDNVISVYIGLWIGIIQAIGAFFGWLWENAIKPAIDFISAAVQWLWNNVISVYINFWIAIIQTLGGIFSWLWENAVKPTIDFIGNAISWVWQNIISPTLTWIGDAIRTVGGVFSWLYDNVVKPVWDNIGAAIQFVWAYVIQPAFESLKTGLSNVGSFFSTIADGIGGAWDKIKNFAVGPINWVIEHVWNDGIVGLWNKITGWIPGVDISLDKLDLIGTPSGAPITSPTGASTFGLAKGGIVPGYSHRDARRPGVELSGGEGILVPEAVRGLGAAFVHGANSYFGGARVGNKNGDGTNSFLFGGLWDGIGNIAGGIGDWVADVAEGISDAASFTAGFISNPFSAITGLLGSGVTDGITNLAAESPFGKMVGQLPGSIIGGVISRVKGFLGLEDDGTGGKPPQITITGGINESQDPTTFGWTRASNIVPYSWNGFDFGGVAGGTEPLWDGLLNQLVPSIPGGLDQGQIGGYDNRDNVNSPGRASFHAFGLALDVNSAANPNGSAGYGRSGNHVIPGQAGHDAAARWGMLYGGDFTGTPDPMHFEIHVSPSQIGLAASNTLGSGLGGATASMNTVDPIQDFGAMNMARGTAEMVGPLPPGGAEERWRPLYTSVLQAKGIYSEASLNNMMYQMHTESSGDPLAYAIDSNYYAGHPSKGLLQTIPGTFRANAEPGYSTNIWDPMSNAFAAVNYVAKKYGGVFPGHAYDTGGWLMPGGVGINLTGKPEPVFTSEQWDIAESAMNWALSGSTGATITMHVYQQPGQSAAELAREMDRQIAFSGGR